MRLHPFFAAGVLLVSPALLAAEGVAARTMEGTVKEIDAGAKTMVVKTADGIEHTVHFVARTAVHGGQEAGKGTKDVFHGLKAGSEVIVHYTAKGTEETAQEIDRIGGDGLKTTEGTVARMDRGARVMTVKSADGAETIFRLTDRAARDVGKDIGKGGEKSGKVTVYYTEEAGRKVAHFFKAST